MYRYRNISVCVFNLPTSKNKTLLPILPSRRVTAAPQDTNVPSERMAAKAAAVDCSVVTFCSSSWTP